MSGWITDTPASGRFQVSTRANADTVLPDLIRPLGATRSWQAAVMEGRRDGEVDHGAFEMAEPTAEGVDRAGGCLDGARVRVGGSGGGAGVDRAGGCLDGARVRVGGGAGTVTVR